MENYESYIMQLKARAGKEATIKTVFPPDTTINSYRGIVAIIRTDAVLLYDAGKKEGIAIPYCVIKEIA